MPDASVQKVCDKAREYVKDNSGKPSSVQEEYSGPFPGVDIDAIAAVNVDSGPED